ncbi:methyltransferase [Streptomyces sp. WZ.A104]|uniref:methyltransferase n=1 Tax=Streptomyces sp. WZ.A104 TaxID=2023771 RepID=UPI00211CCDAA|nr:methyltransferase [Streptomyces sp. WZ.A104]
MPHRFGYGRFGTVADIGDGDGVRCATVLRHVRDVIPADGTPLVVQPVLPATVPADRPEDDRLGDLNMLVNVGGRERTAGVFAALCTAGGCALRAITPPPVPNIFQIIEASPPNDVVKPRP